MIRAGRGGLSLRTFDDAREVVKREVRANALDESRRETSTRVGRRVAQQVQRMIRVRRDARRS
jgi:hypothetical protein